MNNFITKEDIKFKPESGYVDLEKGKVEPDILVFAGQTKEEVEKLLKPTEHTKTVDFINQVKSMKGNEAFGKAKSLKKPPEIINMDRGTAKQADDMLKLAGVQNVKYAAECLKEEAKPNLTYAKSTEFSVDVRTSAAPFDVGSKDHWNKNGGGNEELISFWKMTSGIKPEETIIKNELRDNIKETVVNIIKNNIKSKLKIEWTRKDDVSSLSVNGIITKFTFSDIYNSYTGLLFICSEDEALEVIGKTLINKFNSIFN